MRRLIRPQQPPNPRDRTRRTSSSPVQPADSLAPTPTDTSDAETTESSIPPTSVHGSSSHRHSKHRKTKRRSLTTFIVGGLVGLFFAGLARNQDIVNLELIQDLRLENIIDAIPAGILKEANDITKREKETISYDAFSTGLALKEEGLGVKHAVVMIPGVISTGLESWGTSELSRPYFRRRLWGSWSMLRAMVTDRANWKRHIMLDKDTGLDPPDIKLRAAIGFDATDFFITGYWIWSKILESLAAIGYDPTNAYTASYDWRLAYANLEVRDQYFTRLKMHIETARHVQGEKVVIVGHSMGSQVIHYFFKWVEATGHGNGGPTWVDDHIEAFINISGSMLGAMKGLPAVLSGEMRDTVQLNPVAVYGLEKFFGKEDRAEIMRAMPGISSMLPKGGEAIWGNTTWAPDDVLGQNFTYGAPIRFTQVNSTTPERNLTVDDSINYLMATSEPWYRKQVLGNYSHGVAHTRAEVEANEGIPAKWVNPLESRLPNAPNLKIYCFYGVGKPTERGYYFRPNEDPSARLKVAIDTGINRDGSDHGVVAGEGDGTVNLISSGYMCSKGWKMKRYNPGGAKIVTRELFHEPGRFDIRGGPHTADHVDILGRPDLSELIIKVAAGEGHKIEDYIVSDIETISGRVPIYDD